jgi:hypothetical protein
MGPIGCPETSIQKYHNAVYYPRTALICECLFHCAPVSSVYLLTPPVPYASIVWCSVKDVWMCCNMILLRTSFCVVARCEFTSPHACSTCGLSAVKAAPAFVRQSALQRALWCSISSHFCVGRAFFFKSKARLWASSYCVSKRCYWHVTARELQFIRALVFSSTSWDIDTPPSS